MGQNPKSSTRLQRTSPTPPAGYSGQVSPIELCTSSIAVTASSGETPGGGSCRATARARAHASGSARSFNQLCSSHSRMAPASHRAPDLQRAHSSRSAISARFANSRFGSRGSGQCGRYSFHSMDPLLQFGRSTLISPARAGHGASVLLLNVQATRAKSDRNVICTPRQQAKPFLRKRARLLEAQHIPHRCQVVAGKPAEAIADTVDQDQADFIITGSTGTGGLANVLFGSVARQIAEQSKVPVTLVR
jgi:nucleotide-binding universal stress UspA family protein